jgi:hypothetical protein
MMEFAESMEPEQRGTLMQLLAERETLAPKIGSDAPDFKLPRLGRVAAICVIPT